MAAKFLWQRIPATTRESNPDLARLWSVGRALLERDPAETFKALPVDGWKNCKKEEIDQLRGKETERAENTEVKIEKGHAQAAGWKFCCETSCAGV